MRSLHHRPFHRRRRRGDFSFPAPNCRSPKHKTQNTKHQRAFTLIELIIVILVMLILMTITIAAVNSMLDSDRVRGAGRQIQNYLAGARDRAIYSASRTEGEGTAPRVGVRFMSDPDLVVQDALGNDVPRGFTSMVFVREVNPIDTSLFVWQVGGEFHVSQIVGGGPPADSTPAVAMQNLIQRNLVERVPDGAGGYNYFLRLTLENESHEKTYYVQFQLADVNGSGWLTDGVLSTGPSVDPPANATPIPFACRFHLRPAPMPNEEPRILPENTIVEIASSLVGAAPEADKPALRSSGLQTWTGTDGSFDVMFNAQGVVDGPLAAFGLVHLVVADLEDIERGFKLVEPRTNATTGALELHVGSPFLDSDAGTAGIQPVDVDGDGKGDVRQGDIRIVSLRTRTGSAYVSEVYPPTGTDNRYLAPFRVAEMGGEAK